MFVKISFERKKSSVFRSVCLRQKDNDAELCSPLEVKIFLTSTAVSIIQCALVIQRYIRKYIANGDVINRFIELWYFENLLTVHRVNFVSTKISVNLRSFDIDCVSLIATGLLLPFVKAHMCQQQRLQSARMGKNPKQ